jgi:hypothetical protein
MALPSLDANLSTLIFGVVHMYPELGKMAHLGYTTDTFYADEG